MPNRSEAPEESVSDEGPCEEGAVEESATKKTEAPREIGGRNGPDPTRFGDWEKNGRCIDF